MLANRDERSATVRAKSARALAVGSGAEVDGAAVVEGGVGGGAVEEVSDVVVTGGPDIADTRLVELGFLPELLRRF